LVSLPDYALTLLIVSFNQLPVPLHGICELGEQEIGHGLTLKVSARGNQSLIG